MDRESHVKLNSPETRSDAFALSAVLFAQMKDSSRGMASHGEVDLASCKLKSIWWRAPEDNGGVSIALRRSMSTAEICIRAASALSTARKNLTRTLEPRTLICVSVGRSMTTVKGKAPSHLLPSPAFSSDSATAKPPTSLKPSDSVAVAACVSIHSCNTALIDSRASSTLIPSRSARVRDKCAI